MNQGYAVARPSESVLATNKVIRNTYTLLSMTLLFSALMAMASVMVGIGPGASLLCTFGALGLVWFVLPRTANSSAGLLTVFAFTGLLGFGLGPILSLYLSMPKGPEVVMTALGGTGVIFLGLSAYALISRQDFSFMGGFLVAGLLIVLLAALANIFLSIPALSLAISAIVIALMSGFILYDTSRMIHDGQTNYILATASLYINIFNIFVHLLHILGVMGGDD